MSSLLEFGQRIARAAIADEMVSYGPWLGSMRSIPADQVPRTHASGGSDFLYLPRNGYWRRRKGQTVKFDTLSSGASVAGLLPEKWSSKCRQIEEFTSASITDNVPSVIALVTKETVASGLDDGRFSNVWLRDQVNGYNYTVGEEFNTTTYPVPGSEQTLKFVPLWYDSGEGGITRGPAEFQQRMFFGGSRRMQKVGNWWYFPSLLGTPSRWSGRYTDFSAVSQFERPVSDTGLVAGNAWGVFPLAVSPWTTLDDTDADLDGTDYLAFTGGLGGEGAVQTVTMGAILTDPGVDTGFVVHVTLRSTGSQTNGRMTVNLSNSGGATIFERHFGFLGYTGSTATGGTVTATFAEYTVNLTAAECAAVNFGVVQTISFVASATSGTCTFDIARAEFIVGMTATAETNRLIPSGPIPPTHAGTLAASTAVESTTNYEYPDADVAGGPVLSPGNWTPHGSATLFAALATYGGATYIETPSDNTATACEVTLENFAFVPAADESVKIRVFASFSTAILTAGGLTVELFEGTTLRASLGCVPKQTSPLIDYVRTLTAAEIASITSWSNLILRFTKTALVTSQKVKIYYAALEHVGITGGTDGGWRGSDKFYYSVAYRFEDDSIWAPCTPRGPNDTLTSGYNLFQVDASAPTSAYEKVRWSNIPIGPYGVKSRILLRSPKIDSTSDSTLQLDPRDLRVAWEIQDNTTTTYDDFYADDDSLGLDSDELLIRFDHMMPPRARYIFAGDSRVCHSYGGLNPCAIILAPVGRADDYDLNSPDTTATLWNYQASFYQINATSLVLVQTSDATTINNTITLLFSTYDTLEKLVDAINATSFAVDTQQWRAQVAPGANPQALCATHLTPTTRAMTACTASVSSQTITRASGLNDIPVGSFVDPAGTGVTAGAYVSVINSDTQLTFVGTISTAGNPKTLTFVSGTGDAHTTALTAYNGFVRVISNSLPGFLYFNKTYLDQFPIEKSTVWMTVASPGATKSAPNCFSGKPSNRHTPPLEAGISMGGFAVDNGFVVPFANKNAAIRNTRDSGTGLDSDYRLFILNEARGCCAWQTVTPGSRFGAFFSPEGFVGCDLFNETLVSTAIWQHGASDAVTGVGDFSYEAPFCIGASGKDDDTGYMIARIMKGALWVNYRIASGRPTRQVVYDFSDGTESNGLASFVRPDRSPWGWSLPLVRSLTAMGEGRRSGSSTDGLHLYGWNDANAGSGDGRIDEFETSDTDNGTAISSSIELPWLQFSPDFLSAQEIILEHSSPTGATVSLKFHRSFSNDPYTLTPTTSSTLVVSRDLKLLTLPARAVTASCYLEFLQTAGGAAELRRMLLKVKRTRNYRPAA